MTAFSELMQDKYRGALLGLAVGDALGTTLEFCRPGTFTPITDMVGGGPFSLQPGQWTDDTSMALCLAESLIECGDFDPVDQARRYLSWYLHGHLSSTGRCFDIGNTTRQALEYFQRSGEPVGPTDEWSAGNGSLMRLAPIPLRYADNHDLAVRLAADSSAVTHGGPVAIDACRYLASLIVLVLQGASKDLMLADSVLLTDLHPEIAEIAAGSYAQREPPEIKGTGHVVRCLEAALWAFNKSDTFEEGALLAVNLGDDADTTGAVYGQLAGAYYGAEAIPIAWRDKLALRETLEGYADSLWSSQLASVR